MQVLCGKNKLLIFLLLISLIIFLLGGIYFIRIRNSLLSSIDNYKNIIENQNQNILEFSKIIKENAEIITDDATEQYAIELLPSEAAINSNSVYHNNDYKDSTFIIAGHMYGNPANQGNPVVSSTLLNAIDLINETQADFLFSLGDMVYLPSGDVFNDLEDKFLNEINCPIINAPGNHDLKGGRKLYEDHFGQTYFSFSLPHTAIVVLDTNIAYCYIDGHQREMLDNSIEKALNHDEIYSIFILMHHPLFLEENDDLAIRTNQRCSYGTNFNDLLNDVLIPAADQKPVYLIAGDVGASEGRNLSPYYYKFDNTELYTLAIGLGDGTGDAIIKVTNTNKNVSFDIVSLNNKTFNNIENYGPDFYFYQKK